MSNRTNAPIWADIISTATGVSLQHLVDGSWVDTGMKLMPVPSGYTPEVAINKFAESDLYSTEPDFSPETGITPQLGAYQVYKLGNDEIGFINDWSYETWSGSTKCLSEPINRHADSRQKLVYGNFSEEGNLIVIKELVRPVISIEPRSITISAEQPNAYFSVTSNVPFYVSTDADWINLTTTAFTSGTTYVNMYASENKGFSDRSATIFLTYESYWEAMTETIVACTLTQKAVVPWYYVSPIQQSVDPDYTGLTYFTVNTNVPFTANTNASWLEYSATTQAGYHAYNVSFNTSANTGTARQAVVSFTFQVNAIGGTVSITAVVYQGIKEYVIDIPSALTFSNLSSNSAITVTTDSPEWNVQSNESWITCTVSGSSVTVTVAENSGNTTRYGDVVFTYVKYMPTAESGTAITRVEQLHQGSGRMFSYSPRTYSPYIINNDAFDANIIGFYYDNSKSTLVFDDDITELDSGVFYRYSDAENNITAVYVPSTVVSTNDPFYNLKRVKDIYWDCEARIGYLHDQDYIHIHIGNSVVNIPDSGFSGCGNARITAVTFGNSVRTIGKGAFCGTYRTDFPVSLTIPDTVVEMGDYCFASNYMLTNITIGTGITIIPTGAFFGHNGYDSPFYKHVYFGPNIEEIGSLAFGDAYSSIYSGKTTIHFNGTITQWKNIRLASDWHNFNSLFVRCTNGDYNVEPNGTCWPA